MKKITIIIAILLLMAGPALAVDSSMPQIMNPFDNLQVGIPGMARFTDVTTYSDPGANKVVLVPWIGEYITGLYRYGIGVIGIIAVLGIAIGGLLYVLSGGNSGRIAKAKGWIRDSLLGLAIAMGSYLILATINKELVMFRAINVDYVNREEFKFDTIDGIDLTSGGSDFDYPPDDGQQRGCYDESKTISCGKANTGADCVASNPKIAPEVAAALKQVTSLAKSKYGIDLVITSAFRSLAQQTNIYNKESDKSMVAKPSCNAPHVRGVAVDIWPTVRNSVNVLKMQQAFAELGWTRYYKECWHFQRPGAPASRPGAPGAWSAAGCKGIPPP